MNILLFTENTHKGGLDTFISALIRNWPDSGDRFCVMVNPGHPGLDDLRASLQGWAEVVPHDAPAYVDLVLKSGSGFGWLRRMFSPFLRGLYLVRGASRLDRAFLERSVERLMIVSGGYPGGDTCLAAVLAWSRRAGRAPLMFNVHNLARRAALWNLPARLWEGWMDRRISRDACAVVAVSDACAHSLALRRTVWKQALITYIHNGIEADSDAETPTRGEREAIRIESGFNGDAPLCIMLATYEPRKGHEFLFDALSLTLRQIPGARLLVCGFGTDVERTEVAAACERRNLKQHVRLEGFRNDALHLLACADVLVVPSQGFESFGLTCVEAMARGIPVVVTRVGGLPEVVADEDGGYAEAPDDVAAFSARMASLLRDPQLRREQGKRGRLRYERMFRAQRMAAQYADLLNRGKLPANGQVNPAGQ